MARIARAIHSGGLRNAGISTNHIDYLFDNYNNQLDQQKVREIMNKVSLIGRLTKDPETRYSTGENPTAISRYTLAVDRRKKGEADFIRCVTFGNQAEFASKYLHKGIKVGVCGRIQTGSYKAQDGSTRYTTDVVVEEHDFMQSKAQEAAQSDEFQEALQGELPFV